MLQTLDLIKKLSWYNENVSDQEKKQISLNYIKNNFHLLNGNFEKLDPSWYITLGAVIDLQTKGLIDRKDYINKKVFDLSHIQTEQPKLPQIKKDINSLDLILEDIDYEIDKILLNKNYVPDILNLLKIKNISGADAKIAAKTFSGFIKEIELAFKGQSYDLSESYSYLGKIHLKRLYEFTQNLDKILNSHSPQRKTRKQKQKTVFKSLQNFKYKKSCAELGFESINPVTILESSSVVLYNTKYKVLTYLQSDNTFEIKGTTIYGFNPLNSISKTLRKPKEQLLELLDNKKTIFNNMKNLKSREPKISGRVNEETLIVMSF